MGDATHGGRGDEMKRTPAGHVIAVGFLLGASVLSGCATNAIDQTDVERGVYSREDVARFAEETHSLPAGLAEPEYVIGVADVLDIVFLFQENLTTRMLQVRRDGRISLPYIGDQVAAGYTPMELDSILTDRFGEILKEPSVSVIVRKMARQKVYVLGQVKTPGVYKYDDELSVVQAIAMAGGMGKAASGSSVVLIRRDGLDRILGVEVDVKNILSGARFQDDIRLRNFDIVYVPKKRLNSVAEFMQTVDQIIRPPLDAAFTVWGIRSLDASFVFYRGTGGGN